MTSHIDKMLLLDHPMSMPQRTKRRDKSLQRAIEVAGGISALASEIGISRQAVAQWQRVPVHIARAVEKATGIKRSVLRPDIFG